MKVSPKGKKLVYELAGAFSCKNILLSLCFFFTYNLAANFLLADGVSATFAKGSTIVSGVIVVCLVLALFVFNRWPEKLPHTQGDRNIDLSSTVLLLLPLTPIARYVLLNQDVLTHWESLLFLIIHLLIAALLILIIPFVLRKRINPSISIVIGTALSLFYFYMPMLSVDNNWDGQGRLPVQFVVFTVIFVVISLLNRVRKDFFYPVVIVFFILNVLQTVFFEKNLNYVDFSSNEALFPLEDKLKANPPLKKPDIYLLTYDSYVSNEVLLGYGIDNSAQENYLQNKGFTIYHGTFSKGYASLDSMSQMLNMTERGEMSDKRVSTSGNASVVRILKAHGYTSYAFISQYFFGPYRSSYDVTELGAIYKTSLPFLLRAMAEGQFRFDIQEPDRSVMIPGKREVFKLETDSPKFLYNHTGPGHSQNSGKCRPNEIDLYGQRLAEANREMKDDIEAIQSMNRDAIIIINGDHGPFLLGDCYFLGDFQKDQISRELIQDRFGAFIAIHWPSDEDGSSNYEIKTIQEVFPAVFAFLYADSDIWESRPSSRTHEYLRDVSVDNGIIRGGVNDGESLYP
jgi:hypothetical protein